jgi:AcrR family transcriptional regulator
MRERPYGTITVEDVVSRADVSRSTFYSHFDGKDDLLTSHYAQFFDFIASESMRRDGASLRIAPMAFMVAHLAEDRYRDFYRALTRTGKMTSLRALAVERLSAKFESELNLLGRGRDPRIPVQVIAHFVAATFLDLIEWWVDNERPYPPQQMQAIFDGLVRPAIERAIGVPVG